MQRHVETNLFEGRLLLPTLTDESFHRPHLKFRYGIQALVRTFNVFSPQYEVAVATEKGVEVEGPLTLEANWDIAHLVR